MLKARGVQLAALVSFYNDVKGLKRLIESLKGGDLSHIILVDGKYRHYGTDEDNITSTDGSIEYITEVQKELKGITKVILISVPNEYEFRKRQAYLDWFYERRKGLRGKNVFGLIIDTDEYIDDLESSWDKFYTNIENICIGQSAGWNIFNVRVAIKDEGYMDTMKQINPHRQATVLAGSYQWMPRLWRDPGNESYFLNHYNWRRRDPSHPYHFALYEPSAPNGNIEGLYIRHDHKLRKGGDLQKRVQYQKWLMEFEQKIVPFYYRKYKTLPDNLEICVLDWIKRQEEHYQRYEPKKYNPERILKQELEVQKYANTNGD